MRERSRLVLVVLIRPRLLILGQVQDNLPANLRVLVLIRRSSLHRVSTIHLGDEQPPLKMTGGICEGLRNRTHVRLIRLTADRLIRHEQGPMRQAGRDHITLTVERDKHAEFAHTFTVAHTSLVRNPEALRKLFWKTACLACSPCVE